MLYFDNVLYFEKWVYKIEKVGFDAKIDGFAQAYANALNFLVKKEIHL